MARRMSNSFVSFAMVWAYSALYHGLKLGHQPWKLSATEVARTLAVGLLNWSLSSSTTLLSGGGAHDVSAVVWVLYAHSNANGSTAGAVMVKVLVNSGPHL